jgi:hypothetical protein
MEELSFFEMVVHAILGITGLSFSMMCIAITYHVLRGLL